MLFSILVPLYNTEKYITECLQSVLTQDMDDYELIIINDGSIDNSGVIADNYAKKDKRIKVIHQKNRGIFHTRRIAVEKASGKFVIFLDADDTLKTNTLSRLRDELQTDDLDMILYKWERFYESGKKKVSNNLFAHNTVFEGDSKKYLYEKILKGSSLNSMCLKVIKRTCFDLVEIKTFPSITMGDDLVHTLSPLTNAKRVKYLGEAFYNYRIHEKSMSSVFNPVIHQNNKFIYELLKRYLVKWDMDSTIYKTLLYQRYLKSTASFILLSKSKIKGKEREYVNSLKEVRNDEIFKEAYDYIRGLPVLYKIAILVIKKLNHNIILGIKPVITRFKIFI
ncbi:glycosyltransferase [Peribacillus frigoritolerans]|uniref:glycosyltransferase n=1 Tax=Peribacillus frigoritolerans TaxID=450367 RepID=UPI003DA04204